MESLFSVMNGYWILWNLFCISIETIMLFSVVCWCEFCEFFLVINQVCITGLNLTCSWYIILLSVFNLLVLYGGFWHPSSWETMIISFFFSFLSFFLYSLGFGIRVIWNHSWKVLSSSLFLWIRCWGAFQMKPSLVICFMVYMWKVFNYDFNFCSRYNKQFCLLIFTKYW